LGFFAKSMSQNPQARVQALPRAKNVAVLLE